MTRIAMKFVKGGSIVKLKHTSFAFCFLWAGDFGQVDLKKLKEFLASCELFILGESVEKFGIFKGFYF
jgi:hypothetical protein